jgi:nucleoid DNA-binding protein
MRQEKRGKDKKSGRRTRKREAVNVKHEEEVHFRQSRALIEINSVSGRGN